MERISIFNYEIFYLDYLEGKLGEEDVAMLMEFFEEHPECKLDDPDLPTLTLEEDVVFTGKSDLKQTDDNEAVTIHNAEHFMISEAEGLISNEKKVELDQLAAENLEIAKDRKRYGAVYFAPDQSQLFANKEDLKRKKTIVLWPYVSGAVAAAVISFVLLTGGEATNGNQNLPSIAFNPEEVKQKVNNPDDTPFIDYDQGDLNDVHYAGIIETTTPESPIANDNRPSIKEKIRYRAARAMSGSLDAKLKPIYGDYKPAPVDYSSPAIAKVPDNFANPMENPIQPITSFIAKKTNKDVDFGRKKASKKEKGGFFVKIGKFEFSKNRH